MAQSYFDVARAFGTDLTAEDVRYYVLQASPIEFTIVGIAHQSFGEREEAVEPLSEVPVSRAT